MLSVNIPVHNIEVVELVGQLIQQATKMRIDFEIRIYDDYSNEEVKLINRSLRELSHVVYKEMPANLGRSAIRNKMGLEAQKDYLLFIDADSQLISEDYIENYIKQVTPGCVLCGGTTYAKEKPADERKFLRWVYGKNREAISAEKRNLHKGFILTSNNFLIDRKIFRQVLFREDIGSYGHEDTLLGYDLFKQGIHPLHLNNPVEHTGLEDSKTFIQKTQIALENLLFIFERILQGNPDFSEKVRFLNQYYKITRIFPPIVIRFFFKLFKKYMEINLTGRNPRLLVFDMYKVGYYARLKKNK